MSYPWELQRPDEGGPRAATQQRRAGAQHPRQPQHATRRQSGTVGPRQSFVATPVRRRGSYPDHFRFSPRHLGWPAYRPRETAASVEEAGSRPGRLLGVRSWRVAGAPVETTAVTRESESRLRQWVSAPRAREVYVWRHDRSPSSLRVPGHRSGARGAARCSRRAHPNFREVRPGGGRERAMRDGRGPAGPREPGEPDDPDRVRVHAAYRRGAGGERDRDLQRRPGRLEHRSRTRSGATGSRRALKTHDLLAIDHRGIGQSAAIDCPALQHVQGNQLDAARACGDEPRRRLGPLRLGRRGRRRRRRPRRARHRQDRLLRRLLRRRRRARVRVPPRRPSARRDPRLAGLLHRRRVLPHAAGRDGEDRGAGVPALARVRGGRAAPGHDAGGARRAAALASPWSEPATTPPARPIALEVDESGLLGILYDDYFADPAFLNQGELFAAAHALQAATRRRCCGWPRRATRPPISGEPTAARRSAPTTPCSARTAVFPWDKSAPEATRRAQYEAAAKAVPASATAPFSGRRLDGLHRLAAGAADPGRGRVHAVAGADSGRSRRSRPGSRSRRRARRCCSAAGWTTSTSPRSARCCRCSPPGRRS